MGRRCGADYRIVLLLLPHDGQCLAAERHRLLIQVAGPAGQEVLKVGVRENARAGGVILLLLLLFLDRDGCSDGIVEGRPLRY